MGELNVPFTDIETTLKRVVAALDAAGVPFLVGGSLACWARGGPESTHDLDIMVRPQDARRAQQALADAGMRAEDPPENWLLKAWDGDVLVDLIFEPSGVDVDDDLIARADEVTAAAVDFRAMDLEDVLFTKLSALTEHDLDYGTLLQISRAVREQVDWARLRTRAGESPYAAAYFFLLEELGIIPARAAA